MRRYVPNNTSAASTACPFCGERIAYEHNKFRCGTIGPDQNGEYETGLVCNKTAFQNRFLRCHDLLVRVVDMATPMTFRGDGHVIPEALMGEIRKELKCVTT